MSCREIFLKFLQHITFGIILRTFDSYGDINFALQAFTTENYLIGCLILSPVLISLGFTFHIWKSTSFDGAKAKRWSWILVLLNFWPQYQVVKLLKAIISRNQEKNWKNMEYKLEQQLLFIEPWLEAIPQFFSSVSVFFLLYSRDTSFLYTQNSVGNRNNASDTDVGNSTDYVNITCGGSVLGGISFVNLTSATTVFGDTTLGVSNDIMYPISVLISFLGAVKCITFYLHSGPLKIVSKNGCKDLILIGAKLVYVICSLISKMLLCGIIVEGISVDHGIYDFIICFIIIILIPFLLVIAPLIRYLGAQTFGKMCLKTPQLFILPIVTDYVIGPVDGYGRCHSGCCCCSLCCCWMCGCNQCKFIKGVEISIHKKLSWMKLMYTMIYLLPIYAMFLFLKVADCGTGDEYILARMGYFYNSILVVIPFGVITFALSLHLGDVTVVVANKPTETIDRKINNTTLDDFHSR